jgi:hypothetical protein
LDASVFQVFWIDEETLCHTRCNLTSPRRLAWNSYLPYIFVCSPGEGVGLRRVRICGHGQDPRGERVVGGRRGGRSVPMDAEARRRADMKHAALFKGEHGERVPVD